MEYKNASEPNQYKEANESNYDEDPQNKATEGNQQFYLK